MQENEAAILRQILDWLTARCVNHWRVALGGVRHGGVRKKNPMSGFPDICGVVPDSSGRMFVIEVKAKDGRLSPTQKAWRERLESRGVLYILARSTDDLKALG